MPKTGLTPVATTYTDCEIALVMTEYLVSKPHKKVPDQASRETFVRCVRLSTLGAMAAGQGS